jgi:hypothetical protein
MHLRLVAFESYLIRMFLTRTHYRRWQACYPAHHWEGTMLDSRPRPPPPPPHTQQYMLVSRKSVWQVTTAFQSREPLVFDRKLIQGGHLQT